MEKRKPNIPILGAKDIAKEALKEKPNRKRGLILSGHQIIRRGYGRFSEIVWDGPIYRLSGE